MKHERHKKIIDLISNFKIETQEELLEVLKKIGFNVTQATVSRDIKELKLIKIVDVSGKYSYAMGTASGTVDATHHKDIFLRAVVKIDYAMNNVVIKCYTGMAQAACAVLDNMNLKDVVGTLAGDDTIIIVARDEESAKNICEYIKSII